MSAITNKQDVKTQITEKQDKIAKNKKHTNYIRVASSSEIEKPCHKRIKQNPKKLNQGLKSYLFH